MRIFIAPENEEALARALAEGQGRARLRRYDARDLFTIARDLDRDLDGLGVPASRRNGLTANLSASHGGYAGAYNGVPHATYLTLYRTKRGWYLTEVRRDVDRQGQRRNLVAPWTERELLWWAIGGRGFQGIRLTGGAR